MMSRYSWRKKDIGKLAAKLQGYEIEERRNLNDRGKIEESLEVKSDNMNADLEYYPAYVFLGDLKNKRELSQKDSNLVEIVRKEYRFFLPRELVVAGTIITACAGYWGYYLAGKLEHIAK